MQDACELTFDVEPTDVESIEVEALFCELTPAEEDDPLGRAERLIASVGAWLAQHVAAAPAFIEDGRLGAHCADLRPPKLVH